MINIEELRKINSAENIIVTAHGRKRMVERGIFLRDVMNVIDRGEIIEQYPDDFPFPSCLILGLSVNERYLHVVVSLNDGNIHLITAYYPDPREWERDMKTRRERSE